MKHYVRFIKKTSGIRNNTITFSSNYKLLHQESFQDLIDQQVQEFIQSAETVFATGIKSKKTEAEDKGNGCLRPSGIKSIKF